MIMKNFRVLDIRLNASMYTKTTEIQINRISDMMGDCFSGMIERQLPGEVWMMPRTRILGIELSNRKDDEDIYVIGKKFSGWISAVGTIYMDEAYFLSRDERGKMQLVLDSLKEGFYKFVDLFPELNFDKGLIDNAYHEIIANDFYLRITPLFVSKDEVYSCWIEKQPRPEGNHKYRLVLNGTEKYDIGEQENIRPFQVFYDEETGERSVDMGETNYIQIGKKWNRHKFPFKFGSTDKYRKIIFDADKRVVVMQDKIYVKKGYISRDGLVKLVIPC